jgi:hypothetical protein
MAGNEGAAYTPPAGTLPSLPQQIRNAIAANDFTRAARQFEEHVYNLRVAIRAGTGTAAAIDEAHELLMMAQAARAHLRDRIRTIQSRAYIAGAYRHTAR